MTRKHPINFRKEEISNVMARFRANESSSLVGVGSVGKSNLLHHMMDRDTIKHYMGDKSEKFIPIMIDPNLLGPTDGESVQFRCWAGYELLMHRMFISLHPFEMLDADAQMFEQIYRKLQDGNNPLYAYMGLRYFELGLEAFFRRGYQLAFLFDEFEVMLDSMPPRFFQSLRGLRDGHKKQLSFLTFSREPVPVLIDKMKLPELEIEPFTELFTDNVFYVGPYNHEDASNMIHSLIKRNPLARISQDAGTFLLHASGGFAGILRAGFRELDVLGHITPSQIEDPALIERLAKRSPVRAECETIWKSLTDVEQRVLASVARRSAEQVTDEAERAISLLVQKHLLRVNRELQALQIEPPVFDFYLRSIV
ncbi:MAG: hypothetical protein AAF846_04860 [Chloroflexota bacterium]